MCEINNSLWKADIVLRPEREGFCKELKVMVRSMCGVKLVNKKLTNDLMQMLDLKETTYQLAKANSVHWYGQVFEKQKNNFLKRVLDFKIKGTRKRGRPRKSG